MTYAHQVVDNAGQMSHVEIDLIARLAARLPIGATCVNIGTGPGTSIIALLEARPDLALLAIDNREDMGRDAFRAAGVDDRVIECVGDSQTMIWYFGGIDWLCIDGDHRYEGIKADIANWTPHARGLVLFHDYNDTMGAAMWRDVQRAVDEWAGGRKPIDLADSLIAFEVSGYA